MIENPKNLKSQKITDFSRKTLKEDPLSSRPPKPVDILSELRSIGERLERLYIKLKYPQKPNH